MAQKIIYIPNQKLGNCTFLEDKGTKITASGKRRTMAKFLCVCGNEFITQVYRVKTGMTTSCGCIKKNCKKNYKHGQSGLNTAEYNIWCSMKQRCYKPYSISFKRYGGRGIVVCERWLDKENGFINFFADMGKKPTKLHSLDRINNDGNYEPSNCKWSTKKEQGRNKRNNLMITYLDKTKPLSEWVEELNLDYKLIRDRLFDLKWTVEQSFTLPKVREIRYINGKFKKAV